MCFIGIKISGLSRVYLTPGPSPKKLERGDPVDRMRLSIKPLNLMCMGRE
jgi:hypothetical protein